ncbi:hypothetical protein HYDPIDRAFT_168423 [Hydnomerulius pinastri MD-312]|uniref:AB hydrolase-1 domain-containing protein n=1 Tax=Hydnomerulius pinastri MD-312 TaxID=994086 RepID=A0A0C9VDL6_9AGAM|nr:hypothetical protein HYDPIDRAFT_168423 [Hydnomerulius pinastri MD-312]
MTPRTTTIPYTPSPEWESVNPRPLLPIHPHPNLSTLKTSPLPSPPRPTTFYSTSNATYLLSTHLIPGAYPRLVPDIPRPEIPQYTPGGSPGERQRMMADLARSVIERQASFTGGKLGVGLGEKALWNCVNRYVRTGGAGGGGVTLFLAHANGFPKEIWETMLRSLLDSPAGSMIEEVWSWEAAQHGDSALINAENLSGIFDWMDNARDIANFLLSYLPEEVKSEVLPTRLERLPESVSEARKEHGYRSRKIVVVGHSFGGCTSVRAALSFPKLFSSIILVDPVIVQGHTYPSDYLYSRVFGAFSRRERWASREEALSLFKRSSFFNTWNPEVLQLYVDHGLADDRKDGGVKLKMSGLHEGLCFANCQTPYEVWELLDKVDENITLRWVVPKDGIMSEEATRSRVWRRPANASNVVFHFAGHLIVQEAPAELAQDVSDFLLRKYGSRSKAML